MGLALHNPSDSDYLCNLTEHRHLPGRRENPKQRHPRRPFHWSRDKLSKIDLCYEQEYCEAQARFSRDGILQKADLFGRDDWDDGPTLESKQHHLAALAFQASRGRRNKYRGLGNLDAGLQHRSCPRPNWMADEKEGRALARSSDPLPSDRARERRPPSLERQEAFRDPSTSMSRKRTFSGMSELLEQEELYRLGVLYDDEHERGAGFTLGTIIHDQPLFNVRQAKRGRGRKGKRADEMHTFAPHLPLHLSFSALGEDEALAAFLISPDPAELVPEMEEPTVFTPAPRATERRAASQPALTTIYEVEMEYSLDFLTQPNTQHSLDFDSAPASSDFPDMISDSDNDNESDDDDDEKEDGEDAWALLDRLDDDDDNTREEAGGRNGDGGILSPANADAWVVLGDDS